MFIINTELEITDGKTARETKLTNQVQIQVMVVYVHAALVKGMNPFLPVLSY